MLKRYELLIRQQPQRARIQGLGNKDRRQLDPPPILQLFIAAENGTFLPDGEISTHLACHATLVDQLSLQPISTVENNASMQHMLIGSLSVSPIHAIDPLPSSYSIKHPNTVVNVNQHNQYSPSTSPCITLNADAQETQNAPVPGIFFIFSDLSVRVEGLYRLKFTLYDLNNPNVHEPSTALCTIFSDVFTVYPAKKFPGMSESTLLSKALSKQGHKIPIRHEARNKKTSVNTEETTEEE
ncbi:hypothetical protein ROZALSC1DRAFT_28452 [Rozella allomycis CSF55]|uniref:Velvet factor domain-containing protein n=1 Tax=Rozella allomycis (strain CSF55) TaxID=988480 RepID=A0A075AXF6_ROZAC|nr:Velvet factor domain-containing protein [Rozella allomycis CSF55]RKP20017.1 hypothetical protein ROZALSC1DRAFT_28452 [Rozella allomycis CSF55]|eukprot:EPZ34995.1 Velvet factor domain-containing protein [Rozella allomycis CSF55]